MQIVQHLSRLPIFKTTREDVKGMFYWFSVFTLCDLAGLPDTFVGIVGGFILGLPLYLWLFYTGNKYENQESQAS